VSFRPSWSWAVALPLFAVGAVAPILLYRGTFASFPRVWLGSDTYTHCFFIVPVALWLVWRKRADLRSLRPALEPWGLLLLAGSALLWLAADAADVLVYAQFAVAAMAPALAITLFGRRVARALTFPYAFLFLAVPFGEFLQPWLMDYTAKFAVAGLRLVGVPVHIEGLFLTTPNARWRVIEACSGLRFLTSMFTLGSLFAYMRFRLPRTRLLFGALAIVMPLLANGVRAFAIVFIGYMSDMKYGSGPDHYTYGWILFTIVMAIFFFVGNRWRENLPAAPGAAAVAEPTAAAPSRVAVVAVPLVALLLLAAPRMVPTLPTTDAARGDAVLTAPLPAGGWQSQAPIGEWRPRFHGTSEEARASYFGGDLPVECYIGFYRNQTQGAELIHFENVIVPRQDPLWRRLVETRRSVAAGNGALRVLESQVSSTYEEVLVWHWFWLPDEFTTSQAGAKLLQARARLLHRRDHAAVIILSTPSDRDPTAARERLERFVADMLPSIRRSIRLADRAPRAG